MSPSSLRPLTFAPAASALFTDAMSDALMALNSAPVAAVWSARLASTWTPGGCATASAAVSVAATTMLASFMRPPVTWVSAKEQPELQTTEEIVESGEMSVGSQRAR